MNTRERERERERERGVSSGLQAVSVGGRSPWSCGETQDDSKTTFLEVSEG